MGLGDIESGQKAALAALARRGSRRPVGWLDRLTNWYMAAVVGVVLAAVLAGLLSAEPSAAFMQFAEARGALAVGLVAAIGVAFGLRSGALGGPIVLSRPDVLLVLLSPTRHALFLKHRLRRTTALWVGAGAAMGAVVLAAVAARLGGHPLWLLLAGAVCGGAIAGLSLGTAMLANAAELDPSSAAVLAVVVIGAAAVSLAGVWVWSPLAWIGAVALWPEQHDTPGALIGLLLCIAALAAGVRLMRRVDLEVAVGRTSTMTSAVVGAALQDIRALLVTAHSRADEQFRAKPFLTAPPPRRWVAWRRAWHGLLRTPQTRALRVLGCGAVTGLAVGLSPASPAFVLFGVAATYLAALELVEPTAQIVDQPTARVGYPIPASRLYRRMLAPSIISMAAVFALGGLAAYLVGEPRAAVILLVAAVPSALAATASAVYVLVRGAPDAGTYGRFAADTTGIALYQYHLRPAAAAGSGVIAAAAVVAGEASLAVAVAVPTAVGIIMLASVAWAAAGRP